MNEQLTRINKLMSEVVGIEMTYKDLDIENPVDYALYEMASEFDRHYETIKLRASQIISDLQKVLGGETPSKIMSCSTGRDYETAVAAIEALRKPLHMAAGLYKRAHNLTPAAV
jgi:hypothetical protein